MAPSDVQPAAKSAEPAVQIIDPPWKDPHTEHTAPAAQLPEREPSAPPQQPLRLRRCRFGGDPSAPGGNRWCAGCDGLQDGGTKLWRHPRRVLRAAAWPAVLRRPSQRGRLCCLRGRPHEAKIDGQLGRDAAASRHARGGENCLQLFVVVLPLVRLSPCMLPDILHCDQPTA